MPKILAVIIIFITLSAEVFATSAKIYVWRNEQGVLVYSDTPRPGAEEVKVKAENTYKSNVNTSELDITPKEIEEKYQVEITQPEANATIRDNTGSAYVAGRVKPIFKQGTKIQLYLDGKAYKTPQSHAVFILRNIDRGEHQIKMDLLDDTGKVIASSELVTFYMHRASAIRGR